jgi:hypothetical protein
MKTLAKEIDISDELLKADSTDNEKLNVLKSIAKENDFVSDFDYVVVNGDTDGTRLLWNNSEKKPLKNRYTDIER